MQALNSAALSSSLICDSGPSLAKVDLMASVVLVKLILHAGRVADYQEELQGQLTKAREGRSGFLMVLSIYSDSYSNR